MGNRHTQKSRHTSTTQPQDDRLEPQRIPVHDRAAGRAAPARSSSAQARSMAVTGNRGSVPRSKRILASVLRPSALLVRRTESGAKYALSRTMVRVSAVTSLSAPPMTPATATGRSASAITSISGLSVRVCPSSVRSVSPGRAVPSRRSARRRGGSGRTRAWVDRARSIRSS